MPTIQWRVKSECDYHGKVIRASDWHDYKEMSESEADAFLSDARKVTNRTCFEYRISPANQPILTETVHKRNQPFGPNSADSPDSRNE